MVKFKTLKYKHFRRAQELLAGLNSGTASAEEEETAFVMSLVEAWDYIDKESGEPIPTGEPGELSLEQFNEAMAEFNSQMEAMTVPKASASPSLSGSTRLNRRKNGVQSRRSG